MRTAESEYPLVTIAIPTFNRAASFLPAVLSAACNQTYRNLDILVSDNSSPDMTGEVVASLRDSRIRYHRHEKNVGAARNVNFCIEQSRGRYTLLLMDDDSIDPDFVECCITAVRDSPEVGLIRTGTRIIDGNGTLRYNNPNLAAGMNFTQFVLAWTEGKTAPFLCSTMFRTVPLQECGMHSRYQLWCDVITEMAIAARYGRVDIPEIKASFCMHDGEVTVMADIEEWCEDSIQLLEVVCSLASSDSALLRARLGPYLGTLTYRNALRLRTSSLARFAACRRVRDVFSLSTSTSEMARDVIRQLLVEKRRTILRYLDWRGGGR